MSKSKEKGKNSGQFDLKNYAYRHALLIGAELCKYLTNVNKKCGCSKNLIRLEKSLLPSSNYADKVTGNSLYSHYSNLKPYIKQQLIRLDK